MREQIQENLDDPKGMDKLIKIQNNFLDCLDLNTTKLVNALNKNSESANYLAKVGIFIGIVGLLATLLGLWYTIYPLFK